MVKYLTIPNKDGIKHYYDIKFNEYHKSRRIFLEDVCIIEAYKFHDHDYTIRVFSYKSRYIGHVDKIKSKKELINQVELFLKYHVYPYFEGYRD